MKTREIEEEPRVSILNERFISPLVFKHCNTEVQSEQQSAKRTLENNMDDFIKSLQALSQDTLKDGSVRRASVRAFVHPFDYAIGYNPNEIER
jgi:hypothetical protein